MNNNEKGKKQVNFLIQLYCNFIQIMRNPHGV